MFVDVKDGESRGNVQDRLASAKPGDAVRFLGQVEGPIAAKVVGTGERPVVIEGLHGGLGVGAAKLVEPLREKEALRAASRDVQHSRGLALARGSAHVRLRKLRIVGGLLLDGPPVAPVTEGKERGFPGYLVSVGSYLGALQARGYTGRLQGIAIEPSVTLVGRGLFGVGAWGSDLRPYVRHVEPDTGGGFQLNSSGGNTSLPRVEDVDTEGEGLLHWLNESIRYGFMSAWNRTTPIVRRNGGLGRGIGFDGSSCANDVVGGVFEDIRTHAISFQTPAELGLVQHNVVRRCGTGFKAGEQEGAGPRGLRVLDNDFSGADLGMDLDYLTDCEFRGNTARSVKLRGRLEGDGFGKAGNTWEGGRKVVVPVDGWKPGPTPPPTPPPPPEPEPGPEPPPPAERLVQLRLSDARELVKLLGSVQTLAGTAADALLTAIEEAEGA